MLGLIWAQAHDRVIGAHGTMPWHLPEDLRHFRSTTSGATVVMGRATWESLDPRYRPLPGRRNIVLSRRPGFVADGAETATTLDEALAMAGDGDVWVIGGGQLYAESIDRADRLEVTDIDLAVDGDTRAPVVDDREWEVAAADPDRGWHASAGGLRYRFTTLVRANQAEGPTTTAQR
ncbi:dihydrofolate reductase [Georgenia sp. EYE_87]|uniref:dihydrofolate reductase n=1 Tax=Georgenia sp. EYE_87 TaxID=2853448 RepID=UPI0027E304D1|nr:dihydrofolate reductase [Georgenia sp. EYE_87]MCK6212386.1 dihydrofolate reductase [Georgenia sp. EYE_87]